MLEAVIIIVIAIILFLFIRKIPQISRQEVKVAQVAKSFNWFSFKRKAKAFFWTIIRGVANLFSGQRSKRKKKRKRKRRVRINIPKSYAKARRLFKEGDLGRSERACLRLITLRPGDARLYYLLFQIYQTQNNPKEAALALKEAVKHQEDGFWLMELAGLYQQLERYKSAERAVKEAIKLNNTIALRFAVLARVQHKLEKKIQALKSINHALEIEPNNSGYQDLRREIERGK